MPARVVMWEHKENPLKLYATHIECIPELLEDKLANDIWNPYFITGHYDMTIEEALADFATRTKALFRDTGIFLSGI